MTCDRLTTVPNDTRGHRVHYNQSAKTCENTSFSRILDEKKHPFFNRKHPFLKQNAIIQDKVPFLWKREKLYQIFLLCTSYFSLRLIRNEYLNTRPRSNVWKPGWKQANTCKMFTLFSKFRRFMPANTLFVDFANSHLPLKNYPFFSQKWVRAW